LDGERSPLKFLISDLDRIVDTLAPRALTCSWDNVGFQIGYAGQPVDRVLCALEITPAVIEEAVEKNAQALLSHHPLIFRPISHLTDEEAAGVLTLEIVRAGMSLIVAHTNLDKSPVGTNRALAELMRLQNIRFLEPEPGNPRFGMGCIGELPQPISIKKLITQIKRLLKIKRSMPVVCDKERNVQTVAILTGSGNDAVRGFDMRSADILVTGEINHHAALEAAIMGIPIICAGHYATEALGMEYFAEALRNHEEIIKAGVEILNAQQQSPPFQYL